MPILNSYRRRNPFAPYDPEDAQPDDSLYAPGPELGPVGSAAEAPPTALYGPPSVKGIAEAEARMPEGEGIVAPGAPPPKGIAPRGMPMGGFRESLPSPTDIGQQPGQPSVWQRYGTSVKPGFVGLNDPEVLQIWNDLGWVDKTRTSKAAIAKYLTTQRNAQAAEELRAAQQAEYHQMMSEYAKNQGISGPEGYLLNLARPNSDAPPEVKAWAQAEIEKARRFNAPPPKEPTPFDVWRKQNPDKPISEWFRIQPSTQAAQIRVEAPREPTATLSQSDVRLKDGTTIPGSFNNRTGMYQDASGRPIPPDQILGVTRTAGGGTVAPQDVMNIADAIVSGKQSPKLTGLYRNAAPIKAELARRGYDQARAETDWNATQRFMSTLNNPQQVRLRQAIEFAKESVPLIDGLYDHLNEVAPRSGFKIINKASIAAMKQLPGDAGATAQALETQLNHLTTELGNIYMGGNTPTDMSLRLGQNAMEKDWNIETWKKNRDLLMKNLEIRANSIATSAPQGISEGSPYAPKAAKPELAPSAGGMAETPESVKADFKAGRLSRAEAKKKLEAMGVK